MGNTNNLKYVAIMNEQGSSATEAVNRLNDRLDELGRLRIKFEVTGVTQQVIEGLNTIVVSASILTDNPDLQYHINN